MRILSKITVLGLLIISFASCEKDTDDSPITTKGNLLIVSAVPNPDGMTGSSFMQLIDDCEPKSITNTNAFPVLYSGNICTNGNDVFELPGSGGETQLIKYTRTEGDLIKTGECTLPEYSGAIHAVAKGDKLYVSCIYSGKILILNYSDMAIIKEIDISSYGVGDMNPDPGIMIIRDNYLYVALCQFVGGYYPAEDRPYADVLIIDTETDQPVKMITSKNPGFSYPTRVYDPNSIFIDEYNNIYICCLSGMGAVAGHHAGILRIKAGETEFDESYHFDLNVTTIDGESNKCDFLQAVKYFQNDKLYALADIPAYYGNPANYISDRAMAPVEIDLSAKTIKTIGLPYSNAMARAVGIYKNEVIFGLGTDNDMGLYTYDLITKDASSNASVKTDGYPTYIYTLQE